MFRLFSIDGGGIKGIIPAMILAELERLIQVKAGPQAKLSDYIDLMAGTSTGGILTCLTLLPNKYSSKQVLELFLQEAQKVFSQPWSLIPALLRSGPKYSAEPLKQLGQKYAESVKFSQLLRPAIVTAFSLTADKNSPPSTSTAPHLFCNDSSNDFFVSDLILATSAAPTYFPPAEITNADKSKTYHFLDGGVFANNPTMDALIEVQNKLGKTPDQIFVVSISCGTKACQYTYANMKQSGELAMIEPMINILIDGNSQNVDKVVRHIYSSMGIVSNYIRIDVPLNLASTKLDDASSANISALQADARAFIDSNQQLLKMIVERLLTAK